MRLEACVGTVDTEAVAVGLEAGSGEDFAGSVDAETTGVVDLVLDKGGGDLVIRIGGALFVPFPWLVDTNPLFPIFDTTDANCCVLLARRCKSEVIFLPKASLLSAIGGPPPFAKSNPPPLIGTIVPPPDAGSID